MSFLHPTRSRSVVALVAAALMACAGAPEGAQAAGGGAWQANDDDSLLLEMQVGKYRMQGELRGYQTDRGVCVDLADTIQMLDLPVRLDRQSRRATGWLFAEDRSFTLDRESGSVEIMKKRTALRPGDIHDTPEGWCVDSGVLAGWFGVRFRHDLYNATLIMESDTPLPFIEAIERRSRAARLRPRSAPFDLARLPQAEMPYRGWRTPSVDVVARVGYDDGAFGRNGTSFRYELLASGEVAGASVDARLVSDETGVPRNLRMRAYRADPQGRLLGPLKATQVAAGDVQGASTSLGGRSTTGRGLFVSNRPLDRPSSFSNTILRGSLPAGWDAELYRNGQLLAFQSSGRPDGLYEFDVELMYGRNDLEVVLYGPQGQIRREKSIIPIGMANLRPGETHYWAEAMEANKPLLTFRSDTMRSNTGWRWGAGVERGLDKRTSIGASAQSLVLGGRRRTYVEGNMRRTLGPVMLEVSGAQELGRGRAWRAEALGRFGRFNVQAETLWIDGDFESDVVSASTRREHALRVDTSLRLGRVSIPLQMAVRQEMRRDGVEMTEVMLRGSVLARGLSLTAELAHRMTSGLSGRRRADDGTRLRLLANTRLGKVPLRGQAEFRLSGPDRGFVSASMDTQLRLGERSDLRAEVEYVRNPGRAIFGLGYVHQFKWFSVQARGSYGTDGTVGAGLQLAFSFGPNPLGGGVRFSNEKLARTGQVAVAVFLDENGDGRRSPGERALGDVSVEAGYRASDGPTDARGLAIIDGLAPYRPVMIAIDEASLPDPFLKPLRQGVVFTPRPGIAGKVEIAVVPTGEIEGVLHGLEGTPVAGVELELIDLSGQVMGTTWTEYDGYFLFQDIPFGRYGLRVATTSAQALGGRPDLPGQGVLSADQPVASLGTLRMQPAIRLTRSGSP